MNETTNKFAAEVRARAVQLPRELQDSCCSSLKCEVSSRNDR